MSDSIPDVVQIKPFIENFIIPKRQTEGAAGYDLHSPISAELKPGTTCKVNFGFSVEIPTHMIIKIYMRSGLALKNGLRLVGNQYFLDKEEIEVEIENVSKQTFKIEKGLRIAQMVFHECKTE